MSEIINSKGFKEGYSVNRLRPHNKKEETKNLDSIEYPTGIIPFIFLLVLYAGGLIASMLGGYFKDIFFLKAPTWPTYLVSVPAVTLCMNLLWLISRTGLFASFGYASLCLSRITHFDKLKDRFKITPISLGLEEVKNFNDFKDYISIRQKHTKKWTYISLATHTGLFIISLVILIIVETI